VLEAIAMMPIAFPATVLGIALLWAWIVVPLPIYGTVVILAIAYVTRYLPLALRTVSGGFAQIGAEMDEAARMAGSGRVQAFVRVTLPLLRPALAAAWLMMFMIFIRELGMSVLLVGAGNPVISVVLFDYYQSGELGLLAAASILLIILVLAITLMARAWLGVRFAQFGTG
jgi:iron(III) transport system permease protein